MSESPFGSMFDDAFRRFDYLSGRLMGGPGADVWPPRAGGVQRVDIGRLLSEPARELVGEALERAGGRGSPDLDVIDLLAAAADTDPARQILAAAGADTPALAVRIADLTGDGTPGEAPETLSPAAKRTLQDALRISRALESSYVGVEHLLLALAANPQSQASRLLQEQGVDANTLQEAMTTGARAARSGAGLSASGGPGGQARGASSTPTLDEYGRDLTDEASEGSLDPVVGREEEIEQAIEVLSRRTKNNPCLIGEPGVGKTAIVEGIAQRIVNGSVPETLKGRRVVALDLTGMVAGSKYRGEFEERIKKVIDEIREHSEEVIVFIDEVHTLIGAGSSEGGMDAANILKPALARGELHVISATTVDEYRKNIEKDAALERRFQPVFVAEPSVEDTIGILSGLRDTYEAHHQVRIGDDALDAAARLSDRYISDRFLPDKAIDLMDQAAARVRLRSLTPADDAKEMEERLEALHRDKDQAVAAEDFDRAKELREEIERLRPELEAARGGRDEVPLVTATDVAEVVSRRTGIPVAQLTEEERDRLVRLEEHMHERVVGQDEAVSAVSEAVRRARAGLSDPDRPEGSFLFLGPTGVGKTELARALAEVLFGGEDHMVRIDMSEYGEKHTVSRLIGAPPGYVGHEEAGQLTEPVRRRPHSVVLLDEIEKAHPDVVNILLQLLDDGRLTDGQGHTVDFSNTVVIMTSNVGAEMILDWSGGEEELRDAVMDLLLRSMRPELVNRIDETIVFHRLDRVQLRRIVDLMLERTRERLRGQGIALEVSDAAKDRLGELGYKPEFGARPLRRTVQRELGNRLSRMLLDGDATEGDTMVVDVGDGDAGLAITVRRGGSAEARVSEPRADAEAAAQGDEAALGHA
ncbi:ATP-dependent Clp protease ATP-binding subunit [Nocardiopsis sp. RSe5-2]|uniref:ATP-dependent Clp protease ATP-binding subunit n=1 Tax=Nocardiopsis endophytica TaxID=3018445 RepID=A0ABT4U831_9ACTN|nr:ATP-dependent Clp protease ATP-binding subunit [Nocardiopsis endophytica]MDA2813113.1 ATP-dependent Clp protease ATP-binding subunit [Nocardiopsis endophytica]